MYILHNILDVFFLSVVSILNSLRKGPRNALGTMSRDLPCDEIQPLYYCWRWIDLSYCEFDMCLSTGARLGCRCLFWAQSQLKWIHWRDFNVISISNVVGYAAWAKGARIANQEWSLSFMNPHVSLMVVPCQIDCTRCTVWYRCGQKAGISTFGCETGDLTPPVNYTGFLGGIGS